MTDSPNDPDDSYASLASSTLADLRKCRDFDELIRVLFGLLEPRDDAVNEGDQLAAAICSYFLDGALAALLERPPAEQLKFVVTAIADRVSDGLETWDIEDLRGVPRSWSR
jgi:hypothetical protein